MKRFEFTLERVLDLRRQQAEVERARLTTLTGKLNALEAEIRAIETQLLDAKADVKNGQSALSQDFTALASFERHIRRKRAELQQHRDRVLAEIKQQQQKAAAADTRVKLLDKLKAKRRSEWQAEADKELETLAAESYVSRMLAERRRA